MSDDLALMEAELLNDRPVPLLDKFWEMMTGDEESSDSEDENYESRGTEPCKEQSKPQKETVGCLSEHTQSKEDDNCPELLRAPSDEESVCPDFIEMVLQPKKAEIPERCEPQAMDRKAPNSRFWSFRKSSVGGYGR